MPTITPALIPTKALGNLFSSLTGGDESLNIRWLMPTDPCFYETLNRPLADITVRQLVIAKAVDTLNLRIGHQSLFPFIVQPELAYGSTSRIDLLPGIIWDMHVSLPKKWYNIRLAQIQRISGTNNLTAGTYTGELRFIFSGIQENDSTEKYLFYADYKIDSSLSFQPVRVQIVESTMVSSLPTISTSESETISGFINFRTVDINDEMAITFMEAMAPGNLETDSQGYYTNPEVYETVDTLPGGTAVTDDFSAEREDHGTGFITDSAWNAIPAINSDIDSWLKSFNYPFDADANLVAKDQNTRSIPSGIFREFSVIAPASDGPIDDRNGLYYQMSVSKIEQLTDSATKFLRFFLSCAFPSGNLSTFFDFCHFDLYPTMLKGTVVPIIPDGLPNPVNETDIKANEFGRGHLVLSDLWSGTNSIIAAFFAGFDEYPTATLTFSPSASRLSSFAVNRISRYSPNRGQFQALAGTTSTNISPVLPSSTNRYVTEQDTGLGDSVDFNADPTIASHSAIERLGYKGGLSHRIVRLVVDSSNPDAQNTSDFYSGYILPRLTKLYGRAPIFGDCWYNGTRFMTYNGDSWQG